MFDTTKTPNHSLVSQLIIAYRSKIGGHPIAKKIEEDFAYWEELFKQYNLSVPPPEKFPNSRLSMGCHPCYTKVYLWHKSQVKSPE
jgi:hypothetical protein